MKVRLKQYPTQHFYVLRNETHYGDYLCQELNGWKTYWFRRDDCEIIPDEPRWQDVTGECEIGHMSRVSSELILSPRGTTEGDFFMVGMIEIKMPEVTKVSDICRLRKVQLADPHELHDYSKSCQLQWAFLVERKVSP